MQAQGPWGRDRKALVMGTLGTASPGGAGLWTGGSPSLSPRCGRLGPDSAVQACRGRSEAVVKGPWWVQRCHQCLLRRKAREIRLREGEPHAVSGLSDEAARELTVKGLPVSS